VSDELNAEWWRLVRDEGWEIDLGPAQVKLADDTWTRREVVFTTPVDPGPLPRAYEILVRPVSTTLLQKDDGDVARMTTFVVDEFSPRPAFDTV